MKKLKVLTIILALGVFVAAGFILAKEYFTDTREQDAMSKLTALLGTDEATEEPAQQAVPPRPQVKVVKDVGETQSVKGDAAELVEAFFADFSLPEALQNASVVVEYIEAEATPQATATVSAQETTAPVSAQETPAPVTGQETTAPITGQETAAPVSAQETPAPEATAQAEATRPSVAVRITYPEGTVLSEADKAEIAEAEAQLAAYIAGSGQVTGKSATTVALAVETPVPTPKPILSKYKALYEKNNDMIGWIRVDDTDISFPVMQTTEENDEYYLAANFEHEESRNGIPFLDIRCVATNSDMNQLIYGHNINNREVFGLLKQYENKDFYEAHPTFHYDLLNEEREYEIFAVYRAMRPKDKDAHVKFKYYEYIKLSAKSMYDEYVERCKEESMFKIDVTPQWGEELITLSTCSYHVKSGTFVVVGRRIR